MASVSTARTDPAPGRLLLRFAARLCDLAIGAYVFGVIVVEVRGRLLGGDLFATRPLAGAQDPGEILVVLLAVIFILDTVPMAWWGRTLGKTVLGLRAGRADDPYRAPGFVRALLRTCVVFGAVVLPPVLGGPFLLVLAGSMAASPRGRGVHDWLAGTVVIEAPRPGPPAETPSTPLPGFRPPRPDDA